jgi:serine/threonine-protein phosphatase 2A regulatory subunit B''
MFVHLFARFSPECVRRVFEHYSELDTKDCGLVTKDALRLFQGLTLDPPRALTSTFINRLFEEVPTHKRDGEVFLDFKGFLELTLAFEFLNSPKGLRFFFKIIDFQKQGFIDRFTISYFYRDIVDGLKHEGLEAPDLADVVDEIFDMAKPASPERVTLADLEKSKTAHTVLAMLIDVNAFWLYENRENLIHYDNDEDGSS